MHQQTVPGKRLPELSLCSDQELLERLLSLPATTHPGQLQASVLLAEFDGLRGLVSAALRGEQAGAAHAIAFEHLVICHELVHRYLRAGVSRGRSLTSPTDTLDYLQLALGDRRREVFVCIFLDTRHRVLCHEELFQGSIDGACVYPRVVAEHALRHNAAAVIVAHNHPSGVTEPSLADQAITRRLKDALGLLEIRLLDHFVVGEGPPVSMASRGML